MNHDESAEKEKVSPKKERKRKEWEGDFRAAGLRKKPVSFAQAQLIFSAKQAIEELSCYDDVREKLKQPDCRLRTIAEWVFKHHRDEVKISWGSLLKYMGLYRIWVITPYEMVQGYNPQAGVNRRKLLSETNVSPMVLKIMEMSKGVREVEVLAEAIELQRTRILKAREMEIKMDGLLIPGIKSELQVLRELCDTSRNIKSDIGVPGYERVPTDINMRFKDMTAQRVDWSKLDENERQHVARFASAVIGLVAPDAPKGDGVTTEMPAEAVKVN